jgi:hypothetical protein
LAVSVNGLLIDIALLTLCANRFLVDIALLTVSVDGLLIDIALLTVSVDGLLLDIAVPDIRSRDHEVVVVRHTINLGTGNLEWGGNGEGFRKARSVYE